MYPSFFIVVKIFYCLRKENNFLVAFIHFSTDLWNVQRSDVSNQERKFDHQVHSDHSVSGQI